MNKWSRLAPGCYRDLSGRIIEKFETFYWGSRMVKCYAWRLVIDGLVHGEYDTLKDAKMAAEKVQP